MKTVIYRVDCPKFDTQKDMTEPPTLIAPVAWSLERGSNMRRSLLLYSPAVMRSLTVAPGMV